ncbi:hypothetical protein KGV52_01510 [Candidatus Gracilibacteria bacterium]|nr:hypothetical protein [Candidatus Gracilibacteria bacterium]
MENISSKPSISEIQEQLEKIEKKDQEVREKYLEVIKNGSEEEKNIFFKKMDEIDKQNLQYVETIIDDFGGIPNIKELGIQYCDTILLILIHSELEIQEKYLPVVEHFIKNNPKLKSNLALLIDKIQVAKTNTQTYGTQLFFNEEIQKYDFFKIQERETVNERRQKIGLDTLEEYEKRINRYYG